MIASVALITTVYNRAEYLSFTLDSILAQTYPHFKLLIWDDGSIDHSLAIAHAYAQKDDRIRVVAAPHQGLARSLQAAIAHTTAPYLGWVDSDDLLAPTALADTIAILETQPQIGMVYTNHLLIDEHGTDRGLGRLCRIPYSRDRLLVDFMTFHFRLIRRSVYEQVGGIDPALPLAEDYDLCLKLSEVTEIHHLAKPLYFYRRHAHNATNQQVDVIRWAAHVINKALERRGLDAHYQLKIQSNFILQPRSTQPADSIPRLQPADPVALDPLVSIIIPAYNAAPRLAACLQSCWHQTYPKLEILLVDNGSTDATVAIAQEFAAKSDRPVHILSCPQPGANRARNFGMSQAQGDLIQWLDADDDLAPDKIARQVLALVQHPEMDIAYGDWDWCFWDNHTLSTQLCFGERSRTTNTRYQFTGREWDTETGLYYYRARYYDATVGRFIGQDPIQFQAGDLNLYRYIGNDPGNFTDPSGNKKVFRGMKADRSVPSVGRDARSLGIRPGVDVDVEERREQVNCPTQVWVIHNGKGMSVAPDSPFNLASHRRPPAFNGTGKDPVWSINSDVLGLGLIEPI